MFYSHEILNSHKHGVSTIWLVATIGNKSSTRKVTKKAIQGVNVEKACGTILEPGAPIALRLQGNLLYGVSRVYNQQCDYMLSDAQRVHANMEFFFRRLAHHELDLEPVKSRPEQLLIMNDPDFVPNTLLPRFDLDSQVLNNSQLTTKTSSQMSPLESSLGSVGSAPGAFPIHLDFSQSLTPEPKAGHITGLQGLSSVHKSHIMPGDEKMVALHGVEDDMGGIENWGMDIDEFGNISIRDEPELPPMLHAAGPANADDQAVKESIEEALQHDQDGFVIMDEEALPDAPALPSRKRSDHQDQDYTESQSATAKVPAKRRRRVKTLQADEATQVSRGNLRAWQDEYIGNCSMKLTRPVTAKQARENAVHLTFGLGIANIGQNLCIPGMIHPLAVEYSGDSLYTAITGFEISTSLGKRRSDSESTAASSDENGRRVRPRLEGSNQRDLAMYDDDDMHQIFDDDDEAGQQESALEVGREAQAAMSDAPSSAIRMPWARGSSAVPGSSVKGHGSAQKQQQQCHHKLISPSQNRGNLPDIERFSDGAGQAEWADDGGVELPSFDGSFDGAFDLDQDIPSVGPGQAVGIQSQDASFPRSALDVEGQNFLDFIATAIELTGERRQFTGKDDQDKNRKWMKFEDAFGPDQNNRAIAANAFYNVLVLATKSQIKVQVASTAGPRPEPFAEIWFSV